MGIEGIFGDRIELDDYIEAINANATSPLESSPFFENLEEVGTGLIGGSGDSTGSASGLPRIDDIQDIFGNYIINDGDGAEPIQLDPLAYTDGTGGSDPVYNVADVLQGGIDDLEFELFHNGLGPEEWDEFMDWLRANGFGWLADYLEVHPEELPYILELFLDPSGYWGRLAQEAREQAEQDEIALQNRMIEEWGLRNAGTFMEDGGNFGQAVWTDGNGNYYVFGHDGNSAVVYYVAIDGDEFRYLGVVYSPFQEALSRLHADFMEKLGLPEDWGAFDPAGSQMLDQVAEQLGLSFFTPNWIYDESGNLIGEGNIYRDQNGNYYLLYVDQDGVHVVEVELYLPPGCPGCNVYNYRLSGNETVHSFDELGLSEAEIRALLIEGLDKNDDAFLSEVQDKMWIGEDPEGGYLFIQDEFFDFMKRLQSYYNLLCCVFMLAAAKNEFKRIVGEIVFEQKIGEGDSQLIETAQTKKDNAMMTMRYQYYAIKKYVDAANSVTKQEKINAAKDAAYDEEHSNGWNIFCEVLTWGGSSITDRKTSENEQRRIAEIEEEYEAFQERVEQKYEELLADMGFDSGDPFGTQIGDVMSGVTADELLIDVGNGYLDVNQNNERDIELGARHNGLYLNSHSSVNDEDGNFLYSWYDVYRDDDGNKYIIIEEGNEVHVCRVTGSDGNYRLTGESTTYSAQDFYPPTLTNPDGTGLRDRLIALENIRKIWYELQLVRNKVKQSVAEVASGIEFNINPDSLIITTLNDINQFEQQLFSTAVNNIIGIRDAHNNARYAREMQDYWHDMATSSYVTSAFCIFGSLLEPVGDQHAETWRNWDNLDDSNKIGAILGTCFLGIPITDCSVNGPPVLFDISDLSVDTAEIEQEIIRETNDARTEAGRQILRSEQESARILDELERRQWLIVGELDADYLIESDENAIWSLNEAQINQLRSELVALQNIQRAIFLLQRARTRLRDTVTKVVTGKSAKGSEQIDTNSVDSIAANKLLAFELKLQNLKNKVQQHNKVRLDKLRRIQLLYKSVGMTVGVAVAVVLLVAAPFTAGITAVAAIGIVVALACLGSAIGNIIYNSIYGQDGNYGSAGDFYAEETSLNKYCSNLLDILERQAEEQIDRIQGTNESYNDVGVTGMFSDRQWALDPALFMDVSDELRRIQTLQNVVLSLEQTKRDVRNIVSASTNGVSSQENNDFAKASVTAVNKVLSQAVTLKMEMVQDIIAAHNRKMAADEDLYRSVVSAVISAASAACSVAGIEFQTISKVADVLSVCNTLWNLACAIVDYTAKNDVMNQDRQAEIDALIDNIYKSKRNTHDENLRKAEKAALEAMHDSRLVVGIGGGKIAVDVAAYYALRQEIEKIYNIYESMARLVQAKTKVTKSVAQKVGMATAPDDNSPLETINAAKDSALRNLEVLNVHLQNYVDRHNQLEDASKALTMALVSALVQALQMIMKYGKVNVNGERISIREALNDWLRGAFQDESSLNVLGDLSGRARIILSSFLGANWDGRISVGDLVNMAIEVLMSPEFARLIATAIYNAVNDNEGEGGERGQRIVNKAKSGTTASSFVNYYEAKAFEEEINLAEAELQGEKDEVIRMLSNELRKNLWNLGKRAKDTLGSIRQPAEGGNALVRVTAEEEEEIQAQEQEQVEEQQVTAAATVVVPTATATVIRHPEQELRARFQAEVTGPVDPETSRVAEQTAAAVVAQMHQPDSRPTTVRVEGTPEVRTTTTVRVEQPQPRRTETLLEKAQQILRSAREARTASEQFNGDQVKTHLSALRTNLLNLANLLPGSTNPEVDQILRRVVQTLRGDSTPEQFEQLTHDVAGAARALGRTDVADELERAVSELQEVVRSVQTMQGISERVQSLVQGLRNPEAEIETLIERELRGLSERARVEVVDQASEQIINNEKNVPDAQTSQRVVHLLSALIADPDLSPSARNRLIRRLNEVLGQIQRRDADVARECYRIIPPSVRESLPVRTRETLDRLLQEGSGETSWLESVSEDAVVASAGAGFFQEDSDEDDDAEDLQDLVWGNAARRMEELSSRIDTGSVA